jgi:hypothetical protein
MKKIIALALIVLPAFSGSINAMRPGAMTLPKKLGRFSQDISYRIDSLVKQNLNADHKLGLMCDQNLPKAENLPKNAKIIVIYLTSEGKYCTLYRSEPEALKEGEMGINF